MNTKENCYFYIEENEETTEKSISVCCIECQKNRNKNDEWFWDGGVRGYGKFEINCKICGKKINSEDK
jgi:hypothetical protein